MQPLLKPLTPKARGALCESIRIWADKGNRNGVFGCPLCKWYHCYHCYNNNCCFGCPISEVSQNIGCRGTPYDRWDWGDRSTSVRIAELEFLLSILIQDRKLRGL